MSQRKPQLTLSLPGTSRRDETRDLLRRLRADAVVVGEPFRLVPAEIVAERDDAGHYGICYDDGSIRIRLRHATTGRLLRYSSLVNTLCHELAHLRYMNHRARWTSLFADVLEHAREKGIYRPTGAIVSDMCGLPSEKPHVERAAPQVEQLALGLVETRDFRRRR